ncbi:MAG: sorbosone dehydrogenase family protein [Thermoanaerobaculia bacterium]
MKRPLGGLVAAGVLGAAMLWALLAGAGKAPFAEASPRPEGRRARAAVPDFALQTLATNLTSITSIVHAGDSRLFLTLQPGRIVVFAGGQVLPSPFLDISAEVSCCGERGLLSAAFHPSYASNGFFFVNYTDNVGDTVIARYQVSVGNPNLADLLSRRVLMTIPQPFANHNGGQLQFGPDGYLYIGMGDGGGANDPACVAQKDDSLLGKMLRIDVDQNGDTSPHYGIPPDNPYRGGGDPLDEIWARGLRNPWRFTFDRLTGDLWIADVGQGSREEVNFQPRSSPGGENYGWKFLEGTLCTNNSGACFAALPCESPDFTAPIYEYRHDTGECSITGGYVYRGSEIPDLYGFYVYGDYCTGQMFAGGQPITPVVRLLTTFGEDAAGELYLGTESGSLLRAVNPNRVTATPTPLRGIILAPRPVRTPRTILRP